MNVGLWVGRRPLLYLFEKFKTEGLLDHVDPGRPRTCPVYRILLQNGSKKIPEQNSDQNCSGKSTSQQKYENRESYLLLKWNTAFSPRSSIAEISTSSPRYDIDSAVGVDKAPGVKGIPWVVCTITAGPSSAISWRKKRRIVDVSCIYHCILREKGLEIFFWRQLRFFL